MNRLPLFVSVCALAALALVQGCSGGNAPCDCTRPQSATEGFAKADAVFVGRLIWTRETKDGDAEPVRREFMFRISHAWKGTAGIDTAIAYDNPSPCSLTFRDGQEYLVYAYADSRFGGRLTTDACTRTVPLGEAGADIKELGEPAYVGHWVRP